MSISADYLHPCERWEAAIPLDSLYGKLMYYTRLYGLKLMLTGGGKKILHQQDSEAIMLYRTSSHIYEVHHTPT